MGSDTASSRPKIEEFDSILLDVVESTFKMVFGEATANMIFLQLEKRGSLSREQIPLNIEAFSSGLGKLLGSGALSLQESIVKRLCSRLQLEYDPRLAENFVDYVRELRKRLQE